MFMSNALVGRMAGLLGADTVSLAAPTTFVEVHLVKGAFALSRNSTRADADAVEATFDGYEALSAASAATQIFADPNSGDLILQIREPAGGWHWETSGTTDLPQTITGMYLTGSDTATFWGAGPLDEPITLDASGQGVDVGQARFKLNIMPAV